MSASGIARLVASRRYGTLRIWSSAITPGQFTQWITDAARGTGNGDEGSSSHYVVVLPQSDSARPQSREAYCARVTGVIR